MKISLINGSQKSKESNSGLILDRLKRFINKDHEIKNHKLGVKGFPEETLRKICSGDVIVLAFPLYVDSIPTNLLKLLIELEKHLTKEPTEDIVIYTIINNGFYEGKQTHIAFEIIENWCERSGIKFGGGIGQGAGETIGFVKNIPFAGFIFYNLDRSLKLLAQKIETKEPCNVTYLSPLLPRFLCRIMAHHFFWYPLARKNKLEKEDLVRKPV
ncbi:MAG: NAD(P)H-dependent oxidoreductase [Betaproteobacteria bacterium]|nr:NAD(P)H-dependent oxidoreductase [Betaproteobacteria bacterium]